MTSRFSGTLLVLLPACVLFGPGASGGDDPGVSPTNSSGFAGPGVAMPIAGPMPACTPGAPGCPGSQPIIDPSHPVCAPQGANCSASHLAQQGLSGCCDSLVCKDAAGSVRSCQFGSKDEQALSKQCNADIPMTSLMTGELKVETPLQSSLGALPFDRVINAVVESGPNGCLSDVMLTLQAGAHTNCSLTLHAGPVFADDGGLKLSSPAELDASDCSGFAPGKYSGSNLQGSFVFDGLRCENDPFSSARTDLGTMFWCYAGTFELRLDGMLSDPLWSSTFADEDAGDGSLSFDQATARLTGRLCSSLPASSCPTL